MFFLNQKHKIKFHSEQNFSATSVQLLSCKLYILLLIKIIILIRGVFA